ncbi:MAG: aminoacetone oxidase family FAD-binding enzyme [Clostridiales bacterium]|jgi:predicted Rossmann fold flavoprotein|nr:aminoacetone oxidase family FAD-binding enzyme [Clostridiales bacterium]
MIAIIGGGAAGMFAALCILTQNPCAKVMVIEKMDRVGKKLLATGNGCCNFTNINMREKNFHGSDTKAAWNIIENFPPLNVIRFFESIGIFSVTEDNGRVYPYSYQAQAVLDCLRFKLASLGARIVTGTAIKRIKKEGGHFYLQPDSGNEIKCEKVVIACGGASYKSLGSNGSGFELLKTLGHTITKLSPALTQLKTETEHIKSLEGIKLNAVLRVYGTPECNNIFEGEEELFCEQGDLLFANYGISGPPALAASALLHENEGRCLTARLDFMPEYTEREVTGILHERIKLLKDTVMEDFFTGMLNKRLGLVILKRAGAGKLSQKSSVLEENAVNAEKLAGLIKNFSLKVTGTKGFENSQVTAGGALLSEFNGKTLESKIIKGLYAAGEVLDVYGDCGGYNLHWAFASSYAAALALCAGEQKGK